MSRLEKMMVCSNFAIAKDTVELVLENEYISRHAQPGQFIHIKVDGFTLRRPISIADVNKMEGRLTILFKTFGNGTKQLSKSRPGQYISALGPLGNGFDLTNDSRGKRILLIGGGIGIPPLYHLGKRLKENKAEIISILGHQTAESVFYEKQFTTLGDTFVVTNDGSYGYQGNVLDVISEVNDFDLYYSCGPTPMLKAVKEKLSGVNGFVSLEERMGCGVGACFACVVPVDNEAGYKKICQDGPVFNAKEVKL